MTLIAAEPTTSELGLPDGQFKLTPKHSGYTFCAVINWHIDQRDSDDEELYRARLGADYGARDDGQNPALTFVEEEPGLLVSNDRIIYNVSEFTLYIDAIDDRLLEGAEQVHVWATARNEELPSEHPIQSNESIVTISEQYFDANTQVDSDTGCGCVCQACVPEETGFSVQPSDAAAQLQTAGGLVIASTPGQGGLKPVFRVGVPLKANEEVPAEIDIRIQIVEPDLRSDGSLKSLGRKLVEDSPITTQSVRFQVPQDAVAGETLWFSIQTDLSNHALSWTRGASNTPDNSNGITERLLPIEILAHPTFSSTLPGGGEIPTEQKFSGWVGRTDHAIRDEERSSIAPGFAPNTSIAGVEKLLQDQQRLLPDTTAGNSGGKIKLEDGAMLIRERGGRSWFVNSDGTSPGTLDRLENNDIIDRYGNRRRFNGDGELIKIIDPAGNETSLTYNANGTLHSIVDPTGLETEFAYTTDPSTAETTVTVTRRNSLVDSSLNRSVVLAWNSNQLIVDYDDPDLDGPRDARREVITYGSIGYAGQVPLSYSVGTQSSQSHVNSLAYDSIGGRIRSINYADGSSLTLQLARFQNSLVEWNHGGALISADPNESRRLIQADTVVGTTNQPAPIGDYAVLDYRPEFNAPLERTIMQLDHRGRVLRSWDPLQVNRLGLDSSNTLTEQNISTLQANLDVSSEFDREDTFWNQLGQITNNDIGKVLEAYTVDPDKIATPSGNGTNGPKTRLLTSFTYDGENPSLVSLPESTQVETTWNDTFDLPVQQIDATGNIYEQSVDSLGRIQSMTWHQNPSLAQNPNRPLDVNGDGNVDAIDLTLVETTLGNAGIYRVPDNYSGSNYLDVDGDNWVTYTDSVLINNFLSYSGTASGSDHDIAATPSIAAQIDRTFVSEPGLPTYLVSTETITTGRSDGALVISYEYFNSPSIPAQHARLKSVTEAQGTSIESRIEYLYDGRGNVVTIADAAGRITELYYDNRDRLIGSLAPDSDAAAALLPVATRYDYDVFDNVIATELINSFVENNQLYVTSLLAGMAYDDGNRLVRSTEQNPDVVWYLYLDSSGEVQRTMDKNVAAQMTALSNADLVQYIENNLPISNVPAPGSNHPGLTVTIDYASATGVHQISVTSTDHSSPNPPLTARTTTTTYDLLGRVVKLVTPDPVTGLEATTFDRTENGGFVSTWQHDNLGNVIQMEDGLSSIWEFEYDDLNRLVQSKSPDPYTGLAAIETNFSYLATPLGWEMESVGPLGITVFTQFDSLGRIRTRLGDTSTENYRYWSDGLLKSFRDENGNVTYSNYDSRGRLTELVEPRPSVDAPGPTSSMTYSVDNLMLFSQDPEGRIVNYQYDHAGRLAEIVEPDPDGAGPLLSSFTQFARDAVGNTILTTDSLGNQTVSKYDAQFRPITLIDANGGETHLSYDVFGNQTEVVDPLGNVTQFTYNHLEKLISETQVHQTGNRTRQYMYNGVGQLTSSIDRNDRLIRYFYDRRHRQQNEIWYDGSTQQDPLDRIYTLGYDQADRVTRITDSGTSVVDFSYIYNNRGELIEESQDHDKLGVDIVFTREYDGNGNRLSMAVQIGGVQDFKNTYEYDGLDRLSSVTMDQVAGGNAVSPKRATFEYNSSSQLTDIHRYSATTSDPTKLEVHSRYGHDSAGRITSITHGASELAAGEIWTGTATIPPSLNAGELLAAYNLSYDRDNRLTEFKNFTDGFTTTFTYDTRDQLTGETWTSLTGITPAFPQPTSQVFNFDAGGNQLSSIGDPQSAPDSHNQIQADDNFDYRYDNEGNLVEKTKYSDYAIGNLGSGVGVSDTATGVAYLMYSVQDVFQRFGRFKPQTGNANHIVSVQYNDANGLWYYNDGNAWRTLSVKDGDRLLAEITFNNDQVGGDSLVSLEGTENTYHGIARGYASGDLTFQIDTWNGSFDPGEFSVAGTGFNAISEHHQYAWDHHNRLTSVEIGYVSDSKFSKRYDYFYDAVGRLMGKEFLPASGKLAFQTFVWEGNREILRIQSENELSPEFLVSRYFHGDAVDMILAEERYIYQGTTDPPIVGGGSTAYASVGETLWYLSDHLGSIRGVVDNDGVTRQHLSYDSFGNRVFDQNYSAAGTPLSASDKNAVDVLFGYTGRFWDDDIDLQYNRARWYDPKQGRWISHDPIGFAAGDANLYRYVGNGPTTGTDPTGLERNWIQQWMDDNVRSPLRNWLDDSVRQPINNYVDINIKPIADGFQEGGRDGAYVIGNTLTRGLDPKVKQCSDDAWARAKDNEDWITRFGFYGGNAGVFATEFIATLPMGGLPKSVGSRYVAWQGSRELPYRVPNTLGVRISRFFATKTQYPSVIERSRTIQWLQSLGWQAHHWAIARNPAIRNGEGLRRVTEAGWNLIPLPARWNNVISNGGIGFNATRILVGSSPFLSGAGGYEIGSSIYDAAVWIIYDCD